MYYFNFINLNQMRINNLTSGPIINFKLRISTKFYHPIKNEFIGFFIVLLDGKSILLSQAGSSPGKCCSGYKKMNTSSRHRRQRATKGILGLNRSNYLTQNGSVKINKNSKILPGLSEEPRQEKNGELVR